MVFIGVSVDRTGIIGLLGRAAAGQGKKAYYRQ
jgi:hypothetical protein